MLQREEPGQKCSQHHEVIFPSHIDHQDQTREDHTWDLHEAPPVLGPGHECGPRNLCLVTALHVNRKFQTPPEPTIVCWASIRCQTTAFWPTTYFNFILSLLLSPPSPLLFQIPLTSSRLGMGRFQAKCHEFQNAKLGTSLLISWVMLWENIHSANLPELWGGNNQRDL
jgi:hypothetical protein